MTQVRIASITAVGLQWLSRLVSSLARGSSSRERAALWVSTIVVAGLFIEGLVAPGLAGGVPAVWGHIVALGLLCIIAVRARPTRRLLTAKGLVLAYVFVSFGLRSFALVHQVGPDSPPLLQVVPQGPELNAALIDAMRWAMLGVITFALGYAVLDRAWTRYVRERKLPNGTSLRLVPWRLSVLAALGLLSALVQVALTPASVAPVDVRGQFGFVFVQYLGLGAAAVCVFDAFVTGLRRWHLLPLGAGAGIAAVSFAYGSSWGAKLPVLTMLFAAVFGYDHRRRAAVERKLHPVRTIALVVLACVGTLFIFGGASTAGGSAPITATSTVGKVEAVAGRGIDRILSRSYGADAFVAVKRWLGEGNGELHGSSFASVVVEPIPRQLWPGKPVDFGQKFGQTVMSFDPSAGQAFFAPSYTGEWYLNFGGVGVVFGWLLFGGVAARLDAVKDPRLRVVWILALVHFVEGPLATQVFLALPLVLGAFVAMRRTVETTVDPRAPATIGADAP